MAKRKVLLSNKIYNAINRMLDDMGVMLGQHRGPSRYLPEWENDFSGKGRDSKEPEKREPTFIEKTIISAFGFDKADKAQAEMNAKEARLAQWKTWQKEMRDRDTKAIDKKNDAIAKRHAANNAAYVQAYENTPREIKAINETYTDISKPTGGVNADIEKAYPFSEKFLAPKDLETLRGISQEFRAIEGLDNSGSLSALTDRLKDIRGQIVTDYTTEYKADPRAFSAKYAENYLANTHNMHQEHVSTAIDKHLPVYADKQSFDAAIDSPDAWSATAEKEAHAFRANPVGYIKQNSKQYSDNEQSLAVQKEQAAPAQTQEQDATTTLGKLAEARIMAENNARYEKELDARIENFTQAQSRELEAATEQTKQAPEQERTAAEPHAQRRVLAPQNQKSEQEHSPENERNIER